ncbi:MAG: LCP family protein [Oscillospiraceae bacterium]|nr:LCP family protein [Oscillospiraceae bacterium]
MANQGQNNRRSGYDPNLDDTMVFDRDHFSGQQPYQQNYRQSYTEPESPYGYGGSYQGPYPGEDTGYYEAPAEDADFDPYEDWEDEQDYRPRQEPMTMAARAAGKANPDPYSRNRRSDAARQAHQRARRQTRPEEPLREMEEDYVPPRRRRRRKRHGFRNFIIFLLILASILGAVFFLLFRAPERYEDGVHTRRTDIYNILLCATDEGEMRTDTIMLATLDRKNGVSLTTLPRDTIVDSGDWVPKLNAVFADAGGGRDGAEALMDQMETLLGFRPDGYAVINYEVFRDAVNALGGVTFDVPMDMETDGYAFTAGEQVLNGDEALAVCRFRYGYLMADIQRQYVQQNFVKAMIRQCMSPSSWLRLPAVYEAVMDNTLTDLSGANIRYLALHAFLSGLGDIQQYSLPGEGVDYNGSSCFGLYGQSVVDLVNEVMNPFEEEITLDDVHILTVEDGELVVSTWRGEAFDPSTYDYDSY